MTLLYVHQFHKKQTKRCHLLQCSFEGIQDLPNLRYDVLNGSPHNNPLQTKRRPVGARPISKGRGVKIIQCCGLHLHTGMRAGLCCKKIQAGWTIGVFRARPNSKVRYSHCATKALRGPQNISSRPRFGPWTAIQRLCLKKKG